MIEGFPAYQKIQNHVRNAGQDFEGCIYFCDIKLLSRESHSVLMGLSI